MSYESPRLTIFLSNELDADIVQMYKESAIARNKEILENKYANAGFDLFVPERHEFDTVFKNHMINHLIKCEMNQYVEEFGNMPTGYLLHPRSSICKTSLMLSNHTGIIDSGYRGWIQGAFRTLYFTDKREESNEENNVTVVEKGTRLLQICHPRLYPFFVDIVEEESRLSNTARGEGGFGSTGK